MSTGDVCGWLVDGDPDRPCIRPAGHANHHMDEAAWMRKLDYQHSYRYRKAMDKVFDEFRVH